MAAVKMLETKLASVKITNTSPMGKPNNDNTENKYAANGRYRNGR